MECESNSIQQFHEFFLNVQFYFLCRAKLLRCWQENQDLVHPIMTIEYFEYKLLVNFNTLFNLTKYLVNKIIINLKDNNLIN